MSHIAFESGQGRVEVGGRERARMGVLLDDIAWVMDSRGRRLQSPQEDHTAKLRYVYGDFGTSDRDDNFGKRLGWACLIGNDALKLLAHIHGQCEIHGWVHPDDLGWFADLLEQAVRDGLLGADGRSFYGSWQDVADLARRSTAPLVASYSVCESWPDIYLIAQERPDLFTPEDADDPYESWAKLSEADQDRIADEAIASCGPRWHPAEWGTHWAESVRGRSPWVDVQQTESPASGES